MNSEKNYFLTSIIFAAFVGITGAFLLIPSVSEPSFGFFLWALGILVGNLVTMSRIFPKLRINAFTVLMTISFVAVSCGFVINSKSHDGYLLFLAIILVLLNVNLISPHLENHSFLRYMFAFVQFLIAKMVGFFEFLGKFFAFQKKETRVFGVFQKALPSSKVFLLFLVTGLPIIFIAVGLLSSANPAFSGWIDHLFSVDISLDTWFERMVIAGVAFFYIITEIYFLSQIHQSEKLETMEIKKGHDFQKTWAMVGCMTIFILNLFYILFIIAELQYDLGNVRGIIDAKGYDSYSQAAVSRFWELITVSLLNLALVYFFARSFWTWRQDHKKQEWKIWMLLGNGAFLFINSLFLIFSSHQRLALYESGYGLTYLRLFAHGFLPVLLILTVIIFAAFSVKKYWKCFHISLGIVVLYFAVFTALPTNHIVNSMNLKWHEEEKIIVYDPKYSIKDDDSLLTATKLLREKTILAESDPRITQQIEGKIQRFRKGNQNASWREMNFMDMLIMREIRRLR